MNSIYIAVQYLYGKYNAICMEKWDKGIGIGESTRILTP